MRRNGVSAAVMTAPGRFEVRRYPFPQVDDHSMVIQLEMCGICGTDKHTFRGETVQYAGTPAESHTPFPIIPGHEIVGRVAEIGKAARTGLEYSGATLSVGDRVVMCPDILCGKCFYCKNTFGFPLCENIRGYGNAYTCDEGPHLMGGWADYIYVRKDAFVYKVPDELDKEIAVMTELMAVTYNLDKAKESYTFGGEGFGSGATVVIQGTGPMGLLHVLKAHILGAGKIIALDKSALRLDFAREFGADHVIPVTGTTKAERLQAVRDLTEGRGADVIVECTGAAEAIPEGLEMARRGATYVVAGVFADVGDIPINPHRHLLANQIRLIGLTNHPPSGYVNSMKLLARYQKTFPLHKFVTHQYPVDQVDAAMAKAFDIDNAMKVVLTPSAE
ncbi:MAG: zinc-binding dehydrogenase [Rhizobiales bacterium]|nr:zinc-binding dehydrogenase [Hyphomicrobiales bacterium]